MPKTESAKQTITALNPDVQVRAYNERLTTANVRDIFQDYDIIVDGCDNRCLFPTPPPPGMVPS
jgi:adenylyltransferase/sulfurtransferase